MKTPLEIKPVKAYAVPRYPTKQAVILDPAALRAVPKRWDAKPAVCLALMLSVSTGLWGCAGTSSDTLTGVVSPSVSGIASPAPLETSTPDKKKPPALTIPIFSHGGGRGSFGCDSVVPPVFLSEEEAAQVIREEAALLGVHFDDSKSIEGTFPVTSLTNKAPLHGETWDGELELDGYDPVLGIGFEFVSQYDILSWKQANAMPLIANYSMKRTAERLTKSAENLAVFYDPCQDQDAFDWSAVNADREAYFEQYSAEQKARMLEDLRAQVRDFLSWLAAEGVI